MLASATFAAAGTMLLGGAVRSSAAARSFVDVSRRHASGGMPPLSLTFDPATGKGDPVRLTLGTGQGTPTQVTVSSTTGRTEFSTGRRARKRHAEISVDVRGKKTVDVWVTPLDTGAPDEPGDRIRLRAEGTDIGQVDAYIEREGGAWTEPMYQQPQGGASSDLGIVAIHAALMHARSGPQVVMWSPPRLLGEDGNPAADTSRPGQGQWKWYKFSLNSVESRTLDVTQATVADTPLPKIEPGTWAKPGERRQDNIFCAGAVHLGNGHLLVAGGHVVPFYSQSENGGLQQSANHLYEYDPETQTWTWLKGADLRPYHRWYPTLTTLPDGRVLIASGSREVPEGGMQYPNANAYWDTINNSYVIYDPRRKNITPPLGPLIDEQAEGRTPGGDSLRGIGSTPKGESERLATYPGIYVLPAPDGRAVVAMAESDRAWLYSYDATRTDNPLQRARRYYSMNGKGSRSYPTYGSSVLLPLQASGSTAAILVVGGQGGEPGVKPDHRSLSGTQPATNTAEILTVDTSKKLDEQQGWRPTAKPMKHPRILCDATLLADGTVLVSGGAEQGWGDNNRGDVREAEIYDPVGRKFTPVASAATDRRYHSVALLQMDGSVLKAGSTGGFGNVGAEAPAGAGDMDKYRGRFGNDYDADGDKTPDKLRMVVHTTAEVYKPAYMWRTRPKIEEAPELLTGRKQNFTITVSGETLGTGTDKPRVAIIRMGATTHGNNMDQRYVWLESETPHPVNEDAENAGNAGNSGNTKKKWTVSVSPPAHPAAAPPGDYMLVVVDKHATPSPATALRLP